jgi:glycosyltransferase involved in cell wall biosynthesis
MSGGGPRILLLGDTLALGGSEGQFVEVACGLERAGWSVHVSCLRAEGPLRGRLDAAGLRAWSCGRGSFRSPRVLAAAWGLARYLRVHRIRLVHSFDFYSNLLGVPAARLARTPITIASQRDLGDLRPRFQRALHRAVLGLADHVLVNADAVGDQLKLDGGVAPGKIVVVRNGVDLARFAPAPTARRRVAGELTVGTLAKLRPEKGLVHLVHAAAVVKELYPHARFVIWGDGPLRADLERLIQNLGLGRTIELRGPTVEPEVALRELDIFVLPSVSEACSNALLQAMATRLAVVATGVGGNPALVKDEVTGLLVPPADGAALAKAIIRLIEDPALAAALAARAREQVRVEFGMGGMLARLQAFYERVLAGGRP